MLEASTSVCSMSTFAACRSDGIVCIAGVFSGVGGVMQHLKCWSMHMHAVHAVHCCTSSRKCGAGSCVIVYVPSLCSIEVIVSLEHGCVISISHLLRAQLTCSVWPLPRIPPLPLAKPPLPLPRPLPPEPVSRLVGGGTLLC